RLHWRYHCAATKESAGSTRRVPTIASSKISSGAPRASQTRMARSPVLRGADHVGGGEFEWPRLNLARQVVAAVRVGLLTRVSQHLLSMNAHAGVEVHLAHPQCLCHEFRPVLTTSV